MKIFINSMELDVFSPKNSVTYELIKMMAEILSPNYVVAHNSRMLVDDGGLAYSIEPEATVELEPRTRFYAKLVLKT